jgi:hypothetical protein
MFEPTRLTLLYIFCALSTSTQIIAQRTEKVHVTVEDVTKRTPVFRNEQYATKIALAKSARYDEWYGAVCRGYNNIAEIIDYEKYDAQLLSELTPLKDRLKALKQPGVDILQHAAEINQIGEDFASYTRRYEVRQQKRARGEVSIDTIKQSLPQRSNSGNGTGYVVGTIGETHVQYGPSTVAQNYSGKPQVHRVNDTIIFKYTAFDPNFTPKPTSEFYQKAEQGDQNAQYNLAKTYDVYISEQSVPLVSEQSVPLVSEQSVPLVSEQSVPLVSEQSVPPVSEQSVPFKDELMA